MPQAFLPFMMNLLTTVMFVASFLTIAYLNPAARPARWIALSYLFGALEPVANIAIVLGADITTMRILASGAFLVAIATMSSALSLFHERKPMWPAIVAIIVLGILYRVLTLDAPLDSFWYAMGLQSCFALATGLCAFTVWRHAAATPLNRALAALFAVTAFHFLLKPVAASLMGAAAAERDYADTSYAVISQATSGVLLLAAGLLILISVLQSVVHSNHTEARRDPLTGLPNRRALQEKFEAVANKAKTGGNSAFVAVIDLDDFKRVNDRHGHEAGDDVLRAIATCLDENRPAIALVARTGGEEFVLLLPAQTESGAAAICESVRLAVSQLAFPGMSQITASMGLAEVCPGESLAGSLRRADQALYVAKDAGRNRCQLAPRDTQPRLALVKNIA